MFFNLPNEKKKLTPKNTKINSMIIPSNSNSEKNRSDDLWKQQYFYHFAYIFSRVFLLLSYNLDRPPSALKKTMIK